MHLWDNLTCDQDNCFLINTRNNTPSIENTTITDTSDNTNRINSTHEDTKRNSTLIIIITVCSVVSLGLFALSIRILFYKTKYWNSFCQLFKRNHRESPFSSAPPSFHSDRLRSNHSDLPGYRGIEVSPPKYEEAIVTQIRGTQMHDPSSSTQAVWMPIYVRTPGPFVQQDWATQTIRHQTLPN